MILVQYSRPNISNTARKFLKANLGPNPEHFKKLLRTIKYVIDNKKRSLHYRVTDTYKNEKKWKSRAFGDSDFAGDKDKQLSMTRFCIYIYE